MLRFVVIAVVLNLAVLGMAQESDGPPERKNTFVRFFPACEPFISAFMNVSNVFIRNGEIGPESCVDEDYGEECLENDYMKVRCYTPEMPSEECMAQINAKLQGFMQGDSCNLR